MNVSDIKLPRIVIIGGGFGGLKLASLIDSNKCQIVLIDKNSYHTFQPLMYQVATAGLEADSIAYPIRKVFRNKKNFHFRMASVTNIDHKNKKINSNIGELSYDYLVLATGAETNFFGNKELEANSLAMKNLSEALDLRSHILNNLEKALQTKDDRERRALLNITIVGAGPTGVELAGSIAELKKYILAKDYPDLDVSLFKIYLIESAARPLSAFSEESSAIAERSLTRMGIYLHKKTFVKSYDGHLLDAGDLKIETKTLIWTAGVKGLPIEGLPPEVLINNRIDVDEFNRVKGFENIFAVGDVALQKSDLNPKGYPMLASVAQQQGHRLAKNLNQLLQNKPLTPFVYCDKGTMATIGRNSAVVELKYFKFGGLFAWFVWMFVHLMLLVNFRNRIVVFVNWMVSYFSYDKGTRLIFPKFKKNN